MRLSFLEMASWMPMTSSPLFARDSSRSTWIVVEFPWRMMLVSLPVR